ncbi:hypothetical protein PR048_003408 [Dryococelus australis]|uniref:RING-type E3 ubiquitin transferase n=1 Tax=Dryococelus australis TaxID=614101 RepID=A0ABQ9IMZ7_9NEOP|nr:hypothetical protein PR048_003408 [Dryococelus australis]
MRAVGITFLSLALTTIVIGNAYYQKKQFYPSVVYITKSNPSMAVIYVQAFILVMLMGKLMRKIFFGQLRAAEFEHLMERSWYAITETCLAFTVFRDDFSPKFVALFTVLLFLKSFHWLAEDRVDFMERSPVISWLFHIRVLSLLMMLGSLDMFFVSHAYQSTITKGASVQLVFGFEYAILLTIIINISIKYALHAVDLNSENPWENKAVFLLYTELIMGFFKVILYITFVGIMVKIYTLPLFAFRPMYYTMRAFKKAFNDVILSRRAIRNMNTLYPDATPEELAAADNVCIICREEMVTASKKLPCNHIFHTSCLRSWFQRQQTCPTCRLNILRTPTGVNHNQGANPFQPLLGVAPFMGPFPFWQQFGQAPAHAAADQRPAENRPQAPQSLSTAATTTTTSTSTTATSNTAQPTTTSSGFPGIGLGMPPPPFLCPPFPFMPFSVPPPMVPPNLASLSAEELRRMESNARESVEARLQCLRRIQLLLDASVVLMQQYSAAAAVAGVINVPSAQSNESPSANHAQNEAEHSKATLEKTNQYLEQ